MKRIIALIITIVLALSLLPACKAKKTPDATPEVTAEITIGATDEATAAPTENAGDVTDNPAGTEGTAETADPTGETTANPSESATIIPGETAATEAPLASDTAVPGATPSGKATATPAAKTETPASTPKSNSTFTFCVLSDTHIGDTNTTESYNKIMTYMQKIGAKPEAYLYAGDVTNATGSTKASAQIETFKSLYEKYAKPSQIMFCLGPTHDTPQDKDGQEYRNVFENTLGKAYYDGTIQGDSLNKEGLRHKVIGGYNFFSIDWDGKYSGNMSPNVSAYLEKQLAALTKANPDQPIFIINHVVNSDLSKLLRSYPQVVLFKGHLHDSIAREDQINQTNGYTQVSCGGCNYYRVDGYNRFTTNPYLNLGNIYNFAQGLYVQVKDNVVTIKRVDGYNGAIIGEDWVVGTKLGKKYTTARKKNYEKCTFANSDAKIVATDTGLSVSFDACKSGAAGPAMYYSVQFLKKNSSGAYEVVDTKDLSSQHVFFPNDVGIPDLYYSVSFSSPDGLGDYAVVITATDCFGASKDAIVYSSRGDYQYKLPSAGKVAFSKRELTEEEKQTGLVTPGADVISFKRDSLKAMIFKAGEDAAVRFHPTYQFKDVKIRCTSNGDTTGTLVFNTYKWAGDYAKTVAGKPVDTFTLTGFKGSTVYTVTNKTFDAGEYLITITTPNAGEGVGVYHAAFASGQAKGYMSYQSRTAIDTAIYLEWTNNAICERPYVVYK